MSNRQSTHLTQTGPDYRLPGIPGHLAGGSDCHLTVTPAAGVSAPCVWLRSTTKVGEGDPEMLRLLTAADALRFADQIVEIVGSLHQVEGTPGVSNRVPIIHSEIASLLRLLDGE